MDTRNPVADAADDEAYQWCLECGTEYATAADLVQAYNNDRPPGCPAATDASDIDFCPDCLHAFAFAPVEVSR